MYLLDWYKWLTFVVVLVICPLSSSTEMIYTDNVHHNHHHHHHHHLHQPQQQQHYQQQHQQQPPPPHEHQQLQHHYQHLQKSPPSPPYNNPQQVAQDSPQHHQHQQKNIYPHHHQSQADSIQQALLDTSRQQYYYAHTQIEWKHEITQHGELSELLVNNIESTYPIVTQQDQLAYYHQYLHQHQHLIYSMNNNNNNNDDDHDNDMNDNRPIDSCYSQHPSMLMQPNFEQSTCRASPTSSHNPGGDQSHSEKVPNFLQPDNMPSHNSNVESYPLTPQHYHYENSLMSAIRHYWREVSGLCLASAVFLNWLFVVIKRKFMIASGRQYRAEHKIESLQQATSTQSLSKDTNSSSAQDSAFDETASPISLEFMESSKSSSNDQNKAEKSTGSVKSLNVNVSSTFRQRSSTLKAEPIPIPLAQHHHSQSTSLSNSLNTSEYNSRYSSDFDSIQRLGRGGFGIVFEARNKIDDCHYAVKRICLPLEKEARERVMREVRALAKLDHAGIVRYYNAWLETPPDEWLKNHDAQLGIMHSKDGPSFPSTDGIYDRNESEQASKGCSKLGESGDNSSGLFGSSPFKRRANGFRKFLKNNSSSPSLDIVFEGSGSIRLESENNTEKTSSSIFEDDTNENKRKRKNNRLQESKNGDIISDSEDSDFIQFESRGNRDGFKGKNKFNNDEVSISSHLTDPFSSSSSGSIEDETNGEGADESSKKVINQMRGDDWQTARRNVLRDLKQNNSPYVDNSQVEKVYLYIQMQLCRKDTLKDWLKTNCEIRDKTTIFDLFYQIVDAVEYVHSQDLIHRDLKPSNIFFSLDGTLKIGDFGLCRAKTSTGIGSSLDLQEYVAESDVERGIEAVHTEQVGTQLYMSPEQLNGLSYNQKVDIFAMGLILLELILPFKTQMQRVNVLFKARNNLYSDEFCSEHPKEHELVKTLLSRSPQKRPTATEIKQHELLASAQLSQPVIERIYHRRRTISSNSSTE